MNKQDFLGLIGRWSAMWDRAVTSSEEGFGDESALDDWLGSVSAFDTIEALAPHFAADVAASPEYAEQAQSAEAKQAAFLASVKKLEAVGVGTQQPEPDRAHALRQSVLTRVTCQNAQWWKGQTCREKHPGDDPVNWCVPCCALALVQALPVEVVND